MAGFWLKWKYLVIFQMFELEYLIAFAFGAGLVAITPVAASIAGRESKLTKTISGAGRGITKQGLKLGIVVGSKASGLFSSVKSGVSEVGESFGDILAEAKADLAESKTTKPAGTAKA
jgi:hypothetical protein